MTTWRILSSDNFDKQVRKLDSGTQRRLFVFIERLRQIENPGILGRNIVNHPLGALRFRVGDYRLVATINEDELVILAIAFAHRSRVYRS